MPAALATCDNNTGKTLLELERYPEALAALERCEADRRKLLDIHPGQPELREDLADLRGNMALALSHLGGTTRRSNTSTPRSRFSGVNRLSPPPIRTGSIGWPDCSTRSAQFVIIKDCTPRPL